MNSDKASIISRLEAYDLRFEELLGCLGGRLPLAGAEKDHAQALLRDLKADLEREYRAMATVRGEAELTADERAYYQPVIHQTFADIRTKWNSVPDGKWFNDLAGARISLTHMLHEMRRDGN